MKEYLEEFADRLQEAINFRNMTVQQLVKDTKLNSSTVYHYLNGEREPGIYNLKKLAIALDCTIDFLAGLSDKI